MKNILFCFGLGYVAKELAAKLKDFEIRGTHTNSEKLALGEYLFDHKNNLPLEVLEDVTHILISIPPTESGDLVYQRCVKNFQKMKSLQWIGYCSSTSVYGDHQGDWVTEASATYPNNILGKNRLRAEKQWLSTNLPVTILRLAGIYGPHRCVIDSIKSGRAIRIFKENHYFSRIYIKDIASILKAIMSKPKIREIYNIADDFPTAQHEVVSFACNLMKKALPEMIDFKAAKLSETMLNYYTSNKRVDNSKIKKDYAVTLSFPSYKEGLMDLVNK